MSAFLFFILDIVFHMVVFVGIVIRFAPALALLLRDSLELFLQLCR